MLYAFNMTRTVRRLIFYAFVLIFLIITPPTILYAIGYSFDWENYKITQTGGLYFKTIPPAQIFLDGKSAGMTPRLISQLAPGEYLVEIIQPGFIPWKKTLNVQPRLVLEARNIFLFPEYIQPALLVPHATTTILDYLANNEEKARDVKAEQIASTSVGWIRQGEKIFYVSPQNYILYQTNLAAAPANQVSKEPLPKDSRFEIIVQGNYLAALAQNGGLYLSKDGVIFQKIADDIKGAQISIDQKKLLYFNDHEIYVYFLQDLLLQPYKIAGDKELITRHSQKITQAIFWPNNEYVAFVAGDTLKAAELDDRDIRNIYDIYSDNIAEIYFNPNNELLYLLAGEKLLSIDLLEK